MAFPFGYGLSYTDFAYSNFSIEDKGETFQVELDVKNIGSGDGKHTVQIYFQSPYTQYDIDNLVEKAAVEICGFDKKMIAAGDTEHFTITVNKEDLTSYDYINAKTYILEDGDYYFTVGKNAHDAINNILAAKGADASRMSGSGDASLTQKWTNASFDKTTYAVSSVTGEPITNRFENADLNKYLTLGVNVQYQSKKNNAPSCGASAIMNNLYSSRARQLLYNPEEDVNYATNPYNGDLQFNAIQVMKEGGVNETLYEAFIGKGSLTVKNLVKGLRLNLSASRRAGYYSGRSERHYLIWYGMRGDNKRQDYNSPNQLYRIKNNDYYDLFEATVNYEFDVQKQHNFKFLAGTSYENYRKDEMSGTAKNMNSNDFYSFNYYDASVATNTTIADNIEPWSMMSYFGRFNYNFAERYLFEANIRYDGSSRLAPAKRWKAFPSVSAAWRVNQEPWFKADFISNLKLRASWGQLGNGAILGLYDYIPTIAQSTVYMGEKSYYQSQLASKDKTWETIETTNVGVDLGLFNGRLNASFDYYWKYNNDMLSSLQLPHTIGIGIPRVNVGKLKTWGWDFEIRWNDKIGDFRYQVAFNLSDSSNKLMEYDGADVITAGNVSLLEGYEMNTIWGYATDGYWTSKDEYTQFKADHPGFKTFSDGKIGAGDVKYITQGEPDHQIGAGDGTKENHGDLVYLGNSNGRYLYGLNLAAQWKGFDLALMFQGVAKRKVLIDSEAIAPFARTYQMPWTIHRDYWTEENQDAMWPRLYNYNGDWFNFQPSDKWIQNAAYLRLKNVTLGYTIPISRKYIEKLRVYVSGSDVWEHSDMLKVFDPESGNNVGRNYYPFFRTWAFGVNITL